MYSPGRSNENSELGVRKWVKKKKLYLIVRTDHILPSVNKSSKKHTATLSSKEILQMLSYQQKKKSSYSKTVSKTVQFSPL